MAEQKNEKSTAKTETPLMRQYWDIKNLHPDKVLLFRMGDFFEMFFEDALLAAPIIGLTLTQRNKKSQDETPMCGLPHHAVAGPINKLLAAGHKVAICDQIEDPKLAKGLVKRAVTRILTPGMVYDTDTLDASSSHFVACIDSGVLAFVDPSTGDAFYYQNKANSQSLPASSTKNDLAISSDWIQLLQVNQVAELVVSGELKDQAQSFWTQTLSVHDNLNQSLQFDNNQPEACFRLLSYIHSLGGDEALQIIKPFELRELSGRLELSPTVLRHLEIFTNYKGEALGTLYKAIDRTKTSIGARRLRQVLAFPLRTVSEIESRLNHVEAWTKDLGRLKAVREVLSRVGDIERKLARLTTPQVHVRDLLGLCEASESALAAFEISQRTHNCESSSPLSPSLLESIHASNLETLNTLNEEAPLSTKQGHLIKKGVHAELDEWIELATNSQQLVADMEAKEREQTGINSLKIRYNNVFGYYIEITNTHKDKAPKHYQRKQTLANAERFCTEELLELEKKVLAAQSRRYDLEFAIFDSLRKKLLSQASDYLKLSSLIAEIDVYSSLAWLAVERKYVRPTFNNEQILNLKASRHPVVEQASPAHFVANDISMAPHSCMLLTGPNMAGKSTLMRQIAVISILGQIGSFVPCANANLPLFDRIFTRIGASDQLTEGLSTFMVEMQETSTLLQQSTYQSLVILDEVGRGTSTYDGLSLAQAILEYLLTETKSLTLFATHYHELTSLSECFSSLRNYHMSVAESGGQVRFLHSLVHGPARKSYGIYVGELAGLPKSVTQRAKGLLKELELKKVKSSNQSSLFTWMDAPCPQLESTPIQPPEEIKLIEEIKALSINKLTPLEALTRLSLWQESLSNSAAKSVELSILNKQESVRLN